MQMGILKPATEDESVKDRLDQVLERLEAIESKVGIQPKKILAK